VTALRLAIPSAITLTGVLSAVLSMVWASTHTYWACNALIAASLCDMIDGRVARMLDASTAFGRELDSLADVVAFGVAPAYLLYQWRLGDLGEFAGVPLGALPMFAFIACSAGRLARFNLGADAANAGDDAADDAAADAADDGSFIGIPTPVAALLVTTTVMAWHELAWSPLRNTWLLLAVILGSAALMISPLRFPSYKRFATRIGQYAYFASMAGGLTLLFLGRPGGAVLLALLCVYVSRGLLGAVLGRRL
jgi:CDP-diacylglycerol--serine O-phosphatidyltransferase